jgi:hypothetical protein
VAVTAPVVVGVGVGVVTVVVTRVVAVVRRVGHALR